MGHCCVRKTVPIMGDGLVVAGQLPEVDTDCIFTPTEGITHVHGARVKVGEVNFMVIGQWQPKDKDEEDKVNHSLLKIKPSTPW